MNAPDLIRPMGVVYGMDADEYHSIDAFSASGMKYLARSAWHYANRLPVTPTKAMITGTLVHCAQLEPDALASRYVVVPEDAPKRPSKAQWAAARPSPASLEAMKWWTRFQEEAADRQIIDADAYALMQKQLDAIKAEPLLAELFSEGDGEVSVFWIDKRTGVYCKARPDWLRVIRGDLVAIDLKSTVDESPDGFSRSVARMGYYRQRAHYVAGIEAAMKRRVTEFVFAAVTSAEPALAVPYVLDDEAAQQGEDERNELLDLYAHCMRTGTWPAYGQGYQLLSLPKWARPSPEVEVSYE